MDPSILERRRDPRTQAFLPISIRAEGSEDETPAHLLDLSNGGAAVLTTAYNSPGIGETVDLHFSTPVSDGSAETRNRNETAVVMNMAAPERGTRRIGVRFIQQRDIQAGLFDPIDTLSNHRKSMDTGDMDRRWETAKNFDKVQPLVPVTL